LLGTQSALSRSATAAGSLPQAFGDWLHLTLSSAWLGGLLMLLITLLAERPSLTASAALVSRFSALATFCVAGLAIGGIAQAAQFLTSFDALLTTAFGQALSIKLILFALLLGFGAYHSQVVAPQMRRHALRASSADDALLRTFRRTLAAETLISAVLLIVVVALKAA
jgi:putative copper export protein